MHMSALSEPNGEVRDAVKCPAGLLPVKQNRQCFARKRKPFELWESTVAKHIVLFVRKLSSLVVGLRCVLPELAR